MAIRILLDHGVREDRIIFVTFLVARGGGVSVLRRAFQKVRIVCGAVDDEMREGWLEGYQALGNPEGYGRKVWLMQPGMGQIGQFPTCDRLLKLISVDRRSLLSITGLLVFGSILFFELPPQSHIFHSNKSSSRKFSDHVASVV